MNTFGKKFCFTGFGESHGVAVGGVIDGCPAGVRLDMNLIASDLRRRRMGEENLCVGVSTRARSETDVVEWLSGLEEGITLGTPIAFLLRNTTAVSSDYQPLQDVYRPGHADYTYACKYGLRAKSGGGRSSARETAGRVVAGAVAKQLLSRRGITVSAVVKQIGNAVEIDEMRALLDDVRHAGDSIGGVVRCCIKGLPAGVGEPVFDKLSARLAYAMLSINACKGFAYGSGFADVGCRGSELNDPMPYTTNHAGGILGGISNGQDVVFEVVFKPTPSISMPQKTINADGKPVTISVQGRHDVCVVVRAGVVVEAMAALTVLDLLEENDAIHQGRNV